MTRMSRDDLRDSLDAAGSTDDDNSQSFDETSHFAEGEDYPRGVSDDSGAYPETADDARKLSESTAQVHPDTAAGESLHGAAADQAAQDALPSNLAAGSGLEPGQGQGNALAPNPHPDLMANSGFGYHKMTLPVVAPQPLNECKCNPAELTLDNGMFVGINLAFIVLGLTAFILAFWILLDSKAIGMFLTLGMPSGKVEGLNFSLLVAPVLFMFLIGVFSTPIGVIGLMGFLQSHIRWLNIYSKLVAVIMGIEIIIVIICSVNVSAFVDYMINETKDLMKTKYYGCAQSSQIFSLMLDYYQTNVGCCGPTGWQDFNNTPWFKMVNVQTKNNGSQSTGTISGEQYSSIIRGDEELLKKSGCQESNFRLMCDDMKKLKGQVWIFPPSCCIIQVNTGGFENLDCLCDEVQSSNLYTLISCQLATKALLWDQLFLFVGVLTTVFSMEASAITGSMTLAKKLERTCVKHILMLELTREIINLGGLEMGMPMGHPLPKGAKRLVNPSPSPPLSDSDFPEEESQESD